MRAALCALALLTVSISASAALAQASDYAIQPNAVLQVQRSNILDGVWRVNGLGDLTLNARPNEVLDGQLAGHHGASPRCRATGALERPDPSKLFEQPWLCGGNRNAFRHPPIIRTAVQL